MITIVSQASAGSGGVGHCPADPMRRLVQVALTIYLLPVVMIVCAIGGTSLIINRLARLVESAKTEDELGVESKFQGIVGPNLANRRRPSARNRGRARVEH